MDDPGKETMAEPATPCLCVNIGLPYYPGWTLPEVIFAVTVGAVKKGAPNINRDLSPIVAAMSGNMLWAEALSKAERGDITHFGMLHNDIIPEDGWLSTLLEILDERDASLVSVVQPIKSHHGLTTTGCDLIPAPAWVIKRFTIREIEKLPETFDTQDTIDAGLNPLKQPLLVGSGCWLADLRKPHWFETDEHGQAYFWLPFEGRLTKIEHGHWKHEENSEDWGFSRKMASRNVRYFGTRKVKLRHVGRTEFTNFGGWGKWDTDKLAHKIAEARTNESTTSRTPEPAHND